MIIEGEDGVTHINIFSRGKTGMGRWLSNFAHTPITVPGYGSFASIEGLWYFLGTGGEKLRTMHGFLAKDYGMSLRTTKRLAENDFRAIICEGIDQKLETYPDKALALAKTTLPLCHYYDYKGKRVDAGYEWIVDHISDRRKDLREIFSIH